MKKMTLATFAVAALTAAPAFAQNPLAPVSSLVRTGGMLLDGPASVVTDQLPLPGLGVASGLGAAGLDTIGNNRLAGQSIVTEVLAGQIPPPSGVVYLDLVGALTGIDLVDAASFDGLPGLGALPTLPGLDTLPALPGLGAAPGLPTLPGLGALPALPALPTL